MKNTDAIVEVTIWRYPKGEKVRQADVEELYPLEGGKAWDEASVEIPESERGPKENMVGQFIGESLPDTEFTEDWIGFEFVDVGEGNHNWRSGVSYLRQEIGDAETFGPFREDLLKLAPPFEENQMFVRFLTAWHYWSELKSGYDGDHYEDGIELLGRLDMSNVNVMEVKA